MKIKSPKLQQFEPTVIEFLKIGKSLDRLDTRPRALWYPFFAVNSDIFGVVQFLKRNHFYNEDLHFLYIERQITILK